MMICSKLAEVIGMSCQSLSDDGNIAIIGTPFQFDDGGHIPVFVESDGRTLRFLMMAAWSCICWGVACSWTITARPDFSKA